MRSTSLRLYASWPDAALLAALQADEEGAFEEIYKRYCYRLFTVAYHKLKSREVAEELVQDLFAALWSKRASTQIQQLDHYLFAALRYRIINYLKQREIKAGYELYCQLRPAESTTNTEEAVALKDLTAALTAGLSRLPEKSREVFRLSRFEHCSVPEISLRLKLSEKTVEYHLTKSLKLLRTGLQDFLPLLLPLLALLQ